MSNAPPLRKYYYVLRKQTFEELPDGNVKVTDKDGRSGIFTWEGKLLEGDLTTVNRHMLAWAGGPTVPKICNYRWNELRIDADRPSGWPEDLEKMLPYQVDKR